MHFTVIPSSRLSCRHCPVHHMASLVLTDFTNCRKFVRCYLLHVKDRLDKQQTVFVARCTYSHVSVQCLGCRQSELHFILCKLCPVVVIFAASSFLADRTIGCAFGIQCRLSVCDVLYCGKRYILAKTEGVKRKPESKS